MVEDLEEKMYGVIFLDRMEHKQIRVNRRTRIFWDCFDDEHVVGIASNDIDMIQHTLNDPHPFPSPVTRIVMLMMQALIEDFEPPILLVYMIFEKMRGVGQSRL